MIVILIYNLAMNSNDHDQGRQGEFAQVWPGGIVAQAELNKRVPRTSSARLLSGGQELEIEHNGALYRLRQTSLGKLILTK
jgi:hemin uptake protein HemP